MITYDYVSEHGWLFLLIILLAFGAIVLAVILLKKYSPHFKSQEKPKSEEEIAKEEVDRLIQPMEDEKPTNESAKEPTKEKEEKVVEKVPTKKEAADYESHRATVSTEDESFAKQMEDYAKAHPEEEELSSSNAIKNNEKNKK